MPEQLDEKTKAEALSGVSWHDLRQKWPSLSAVERRGMLLRAADSLWRAWKNKINLASFPLPLLVFQEEAVVLPGVDMYTIRRSLRNGEVIAGLIRQQAVVGFKPSLSLVYEDHFVTVGVAHEMRHRRVSA